MGRIGRYCAYAAGVLALLVLGAVLLLPQLLDRPGIAAQIQAKLSDAVNGEVRWREFRVRILPTPHATVRGLNLKTAAARVSADEVDVTLQLWPLFHGRAEIRSLTLARPLLELTVVPAVSVPQEAQLAPAQTPLEAYRSTLRALADALQEFAPDTAIAIDNAGVTVSIEGIPPLEFSDLTLRARTAREGVEIDATAKSRYWTQLKLAGRMRYADLSSTAELHLVRVQGQAWLDWLLKSAGLSVAIPDVDLTARFSADPAKALELALDGAAKTLTLTRAGKRLAASPIVLKAKLAIDASEATVQVRQLAVGATHLDGGVLRYSPKSGVAGTNLGVHVDLAQLLGYGRELAPQALARIESASGALAGRAQVAWQGDAWHFGISVDKSDAAVEVKELPGPFRLASAAVEVDSSAVTAERVAVSSPAGNVHVANARYAFKDGAASGKAELDLDMAQTLALARAVLPGTDIVEAASGRLRASASAELEGKSWKAAVRIAQSDAQVKLKPLSAPIGLAGGAVDADALGVKAENVALALQASNVRVTKARYVFKTGAAAASAELDLDVAQVLALARAALPEASRASLDVVESAGGRMRVSASGEYKDPSWSAAVQLAESDAQAKLGPLPAPVMLSSASLRATPKMIAIERAAVKLLDASASASATISDYTDALQVQASVAEATLGPKVLAWVWATAALPESLALNAPLRVAVPRFGWGPDGALEVEAQARFGSGVQVSVDLALSAQELQVRRAHVKDRTSDMSVSLRKRGSAIDGRYAGTLDSRTVAAMLKSAAAPSGAVSGELSFAYDRAQPRRTRVEGQLKGERVDLSWLAGAPAGLERLDLSADGDSVHIGEASLQWAGQRVTLRGSAKRGPDGPVVDAQIESPGILVDALLPKPKAETKKPNEKPAAIWPLPVTGRIAARSKLVQYQHYKVEPLSAVVLLERERAVLDVQEALVCGLAVPLRLEAKPGGYAAAVQIAAQKQRIEQTAQCLAGEKLLLTGPADLRVDVRTQGQPAELVQNLKGTVSVDIRNGTVTKFALLGNILSMQNVAALIKDGPQLGADAFPFRQLSARGRFDKGRFHLDEGVFHSNAIGLGANGSIGLTDFQASLTVLVAPLALVDEAVRKLPLLGYVVGGTFTSLPVAVNGDIRDPLVVPLGPRAITNEMMGLLTRTLSLPGKVVPGTAK